MKREYWLVGFGFLLFPVAYYMIAAVNNSFRHDTQTT
jgi:hypothetical protein